MKKAMKRLLAATSAGAVLCGSLALSSLLGSSTTLTASAATDSVADQTKVGTLGIAGGGFVSGIITGKNVMYARTDVGGAYKYNYDTGKWDQMLSDLNDSERGFLSVDAMCIDPTDDDTIYLLCGCAYFSDAKTEIFRSRDGGETFDQIDVTDLIQVHGNGYGRQCGEAIAVDPDNPNIIYCGGDATAGNSGLIMSEDGGDTWKSVKGYGDLDLFTYEINWPSWTEHKVLSTAEAYDKNANGVAAVQIQNGKVYVATSVKGVTNVHVADVGSDDFQPLSEELPTDCFPSRINVDADGNLLITYVAGLAFDGSNGGAYRYDVTNHTVTDISPRPKGQNAAIGAVVSDKNDANKLVATSCGLWWSQLYHDVGEDWSKVPNGDLIFRSEDGGKTWYTMQHGCSGEGAWGTKSADYLDTNGYSWIDGFAVHWSGAIVMDPENPDKVLVTSGNGVFACDDIWAELPQFYFDPKGIEEVVALDMISAPGKNPYSVIGDYDGFEHLDTVNSNRFSPTMTAATGDKGSASAIAYCPQNPDVMMRCAEDKGVGYYTLDGGKNWTQMECPTGGKAAITQLEDGTYRFFKSSGENATNVSYSDDYGKTWTACSGIASAYGSKPTFMMVEKNDPSIVYAYSTYYNSSWGYSKPAPDLSDACYKFYVSHDYGKTFSEETDVAMYDQCDSAGRIAYLGDGELMLGAGYYGAYHVTDYGKKVEKLDNVSYCKTIGYGAPEEEGGVNTLYMYGKPSEDDVEGVYRSTDAGKTWVAINLHHLYGGTGNGNFLVGDMNKFGMVYMSTVGCGIVYMDSSDGTDPKPVTTTTTTATTTTTTTATLTTTKAADTTTTDKGTTTTAAATTTTDKGTTTTAAATTTTNKGTTTSNAVTTTQDIGEMNYGDVNVNGVVDLTDAVLLNKFLAGIVQLTDIQYANANCDQTDGTNNVGELDTTALMRFVLNVEGYQELPYIAQD